MVNNMSKWSLVSVVCVLLLTSCETVKPWQRGNLARPEMALSTDGLAQKTQDHIYHSKEGSASVGAGSGGGCGCN
jgi:hypothetical protein